VNPYAETARARKAARLLVECDGRGLDAAAAAALDPDGWEALAAAAGVHRPSPETCALVLDSLRRLATVRAALPDDPFEGLP
jgi:hypothetical protein